MPHWARAWRNGHVLCLCLFQPNVVLLIAVFLVLWAHLSVQNRLTTFLFLLVTGIWNKFLLVWSIQGFSNGGVFEAVEEKAALLSKGRDLLDRVFRTNTLCHQAGILGSDRKCVYMNGEKKVNKILNWNFPEWGKIQRLSLFSIVSTGRLPLA